MKTKEYAKKYFEKKAIKASKDKQQLIATAKRTYQKFNQPKNKDALGKAYDELMTFLALVRAWASGEYNEIPWKTIIKVIMAVLYALVPTDLIPDFIIGAGLIDDAAVILWVGNSVREDLSTFKKWLKHSKDKKPKKKSKKEKAGNPLFS